MASPILVAVFAIILGSCSLTQAYSQPSHSTGTRLEEVKLDQLSNDNKWNINISADCAAWLGMGSFLVVPTYGYLVMYYFEIEKQRKFNIAKCEQVQNPDDKANCIRRHEEQAKQDRTRCLQVTVAMSFVATMTGINIKDNCFPK